MKLEQALDQIHLGDCVEAMQSLPTGSVQLAFADPPFNIGYAYDEYDDQLDSEKYIAWSSDWMAQVHRVLSDTGAFWLAIGDEYAAELKVEAQKIGFHTRSWVVWYYTFGVHCKHKFTRSHAHIFHLVKDAKQYTFNRDDIAVPSARQLVYGDKRANASGRTPEDTWILRPQDCVDGFTADEDTWFLPRVAGTFKERAGFHGCQMPEQLLGRIVKTCTSEGEVVMDPFGGSGTTLAVAEKLGRRFIGFEMSKDYVKLAGDRIDSVCVGDDLEESPEPNSTASRKRKDTLADQRGFTTTQLEFPQLNSEVDAIVDAFSKANRGFSVDRVVADPLLNDDFQLQCDRISIPGTHAERNRFLFRIRKSGELKRAGVTTSKRTSFSWEHMDAFLFASEIAWRRVSELYAGASLDEILCDPRLAEKFDSIADSFAGGFSALEYRWAAIKLRKESSNGRKRAERLKPKGMGLEKFKHSEFNVFKKRQLKDLPNTPGVYAIRLQDQPFLYAGETSNLRSRLELQLAKSARSRWPSSQQNSAKLMIAVRLIETITDARLARQSQLQKWHRPVWNFNELIAV